MDRREFLGASAALAMTPAAQARAADGVADFVAAKVAESGFHGTVLVEQAGKILHHNGYGLAERGFAIPCAADTLYPVSSITKLFTSVLVLRAAARGRIRLEATIAAYLPGYRGAGAQRVTVLQLLHHLSGIENFDKDLTGFDKAVREGMPAYQLPHDSQALLDRYASGPLVREPGSGFEYNNADYVILGKLLEAVEGVPWDVLVQREILDPLGLKNSGLLRHDLILPRLASTYYRDGEKPLIRDLPAYRENWYAAGGMYSDAADLLAFARALYEGDRLLDAKMRATLLTPMLDEYGCGLWVSDFKVAGKPRRFAQRPGSIMGANALLMRFLDDRLTIILLGNTNLADTDRFGFRIARHLLGPA